MTSKLIFAFLLIICALSVSAQLQPTCLNTTYSCASKGDSCTGNSLGCANATSGTCCAVGLWCISGTCQISSEVGSTCNATTGCKPSLTDGGYPFNCVNGTCQYTYLAGDDCTSNTDCALGLNCTGGICTGIAQGMQCNVTTQNCAWGLYCAPNGTIFSCFNTTAAGGTCGANTICAPYSTCLGGKCVQYYSQTTAGTACTANDGYDTCGNDLVCDFTSQKCATAQTTLTSCTNNSDCGNVTAFALCLCSTYTGDKYCLPTPDINPCTEQDNALYSCLVEYKCSLPSDAPESCSYNNCYSEYKKSFSCGCTIAKDIFGECNYISYCHGFPVWAIIVIIIVAIVLVLAVVLLVFFMMRRRRQYDSI